MRELVFVRSGRLAWAERPPPGVVDDTDALVRPFVAGRCDGDTLCIHRPVTRAMQAGLRLGLVDPVVASIVGHAPFHGPFAIGHECVAQVTAIGSQVHSLSIGDIVVVPWALSCGRCKRCAAGLTAKCSTMAAQSPGRTLAAFGFGDATGKWGGMVSDSLRIPYAEHMLVRVPQGVDPLRVASASDNLSDAWRSVVVPLQSRPGGSVLLIGGSAQSIGLYAAGLAAAHGASSVDYFDTDQSRLAIAESFGASAHPVRSLRHLARLNELAGRYDVAVEASSRSAGLQIALRALRPGGCCQATGYYLSPGTRIPVMSMYATSSTLNAGVSHVRPVLPDLLAFVAETGFPAERVASLVADWNDAPYAYAEKATKVVLCRPPLPA